MRISKRAKYTLAVPAFVVASVVTQFTQVIPTYAATLTWTGGGDGTSFSDSANWNTGAIPGDGDAITFNVAGLTAPGTLNNDITDLDLIGITFSGVADSYYSYTVNGNALNVEGAIANTSTGTDSTFATPTVAAPLTLTGNTTASRVNLGSVNTAGFALTVGGAQDCGINVSGNITGGGSLNVTGTGVNIRGNNTYTGATTVTGTGIFAATGFGAASTGTTVSGAGQLYIVSTENTTVSEPLTLGGSGRIVTSQGYFGCMGGDGPATNLTLNGGVVLTSDFRFTGVNNLIVSAPYNANGHAFTVLGGSTASLTLPSGEIEAPTETVPFDGENSNYETVGNKQTGILNGSRESVSVQSGGVLKGTGSANTIWVNAGGILAPGNSPGTITALEALGLSGQLQAEILNKDTYDKVVAGENAAPGDNTVMLMSGATLNAVLYDGWSITNGDTFMIIDNRGDQPVSGTFDSLAEGAQIVVDGITFSISYVGGDGNDVVLTALNTGSDPSTPNTGVHRFVAANPIVLAVLGALSAGLLIAIALRRKSTRS